MHLKNRYAETKPDFAQLASKYPHFAPFVAVTPQGYASIDFQDASALRSLTRSLLKEDWGYEVDLREDRLCPTLANRLDYLLHVLDIQDGLDMREAATSQGHAKRARPCQGTALRVLDIGTGASAIYPLLLHRLRPNAEIWATELDETSYTQATSVLSANRIPTSSIALLRAAADQPILFPLLLPDTPHFDFTICNPPFFGSEAEMRDGQAMKVDGAHAAPTGAEYELITRGGEVGFVGGMMEESVRAGERSRWYTSLIGKYSSLQPLVDRLRLLKIDNYFVKSIKQAKTARWIIGWSHTATRLPDTLTRPASLIPGTSFARILPPPNTFSITPDPPMPLSELHTRVIEVLRSIRLIDESAAAPEAAPDRANGGRGRTHSAAILLQPTGNTWSRAARRQAKGMHAGVLGDESTLNGALSGVQGVDDARRAATPLFVAELQATSAEAFDAGGTTAPAAAKLELHWLEGRDRAVIDALWKFLLSKAGLVGKRGFGDDGAREGSKRVRQ